MGLGSFLLDSGRCSLDTTDDGSAGVLHGIHSVLPCDLGILLLVQALLASSKSIALASLDFVFYRSEGLLRGACLLFDDFSGVSEGEAEERHEIMEDGGAF